MNENERRDIASAIERRGYFQAGHRLGIVEVGEVRQHLEMRPTYNSHVFRLSSQQPKAWEDHRSSGSPVACWTLEDAVTAPHMLATALSFVDVARAFLGVESPSLYSMNAWWSFPLGPMKKDTQEFHRDPDDTKFLSIFFYLTDIGADACQEIVPREKAIDMDGDMSFAGFEADKLTGSMGTVALLDTSLPHRGRKPLYYPRLMAWARYGASEVPAAYTYDELRPVVAPTVAERLTEEERRICRLILAG